MGHGVKALALAAMMLAYTTTAGAVAWKAQGYYYVWFDIEEIGFKGEALLEYSGRLTPAQIEEGLNNEGAWFNFQIKHGLRGWDRVNDGPWIPLIPPPGGFSPVVFLDTEFFEPAGAWNWDDWGQFNFIRADGVGTYAQFRWDGASYYCDWDSSDGTCESDVGVFDFNYGWESEGTAHEVPEPSLPALLGVGLFWMIASRRRATDNSCRSNPSAVA